MCPAVRSGLVPSHRRPERMRRRAEEGWGCTSVGRFRRANRAIHSGLAVAAQDLAPPLKSSRASIVIGRNWPTVIEKFRANQLRANLAPKIRTETVTPRNNASAAIKGIIHLLRRIVNRDQFSSVREASPDQRGSATGVLTKMKHRVSRAAIYGHQCDIESMICSSAYGRP